MKTLELLGMQLAGIDRRELLDHVFTSLREKRGGWIITANLDFLRRYTKDPVARDVYQSADIRVADGMPLVWAARLQGDECPERLAGSTLIWLIAERAASEGRSIYLLGGDPGAGEEAETELKARWPDLRFAGRSSPWVSNPPTKEEMDAICEEVVAAGPDILLVGLGSPKQEWVIQALRAVLPQTWMMGVGISFSFVAGRVKRAPMWVRRIGLEWVHRLVQEPRRLARRYLLEDLPFSVTLFAGAFKERRSRGSNRE